MVIVYNFGVMYDSPEITEIFASVNYGQKCNTEP